MTRIGFGLGYGKFMDAPEIADWMRKAEEHGYEVVMCRRIVRLFGNDPFQIVSGFVVVFLPDVQ